MSPLEEHGERGNIIFVLFLPLPASLILFHIKSKRNAKSGLCDVLLLYEFHRNMEKSEEMLNLPYIKFVNVKYIYQNSY